MIDLTRRHTDATLAELQAGRDRLLELNSCDPQQAQRLIEGINEQECEDTSTDINIKDFMSNVFEAYGVEQERHSDNAWVIRPGDHMQHDHFPGLLSEGMTTTFDRRQALSREDMHFLTWEHPMVSGCLDMITGSERGNTALCTIKLPPLKPGTLMVEAIYQLHCPAPKHYQMQRFFSGANLRLLIDDQDRELGHVLTFDAISQRAEKVKLKLGQQLMRQGRERINAVIDKTLVKAEAKQQSLIEEACQRLYDSAQGEIDRLTALARSATSATKLNSCNSASKNSWLNNKVSTQMRCA